VPGGAATAPSAGAAAVTAEREFSPG
jgi:hypothetical protein